jgi:prolyl-tRNA synthetase
MTALKRKGITVKFDDDDQTRPGFKFAEYELKGVPVRIAMGMRDFENGTIEVARRDTMEKQTVELNDQTDEFIKNLLDDIQQNIYQKALNFRIENTKKVDNWEDFKKQIEEGGFLLCHWDGTSETEEKIKESTKATIRCIPLDAVEEDGKCVYTGNPSKQRVIFARAY